MLKLVLHNIFVPLLAVLVLVSTFSLTVEKHFCGSNLVDVALFTSVKKCESHVNVLTPKTTQITKKSCCKDELKVFEGQNQLDIKYPLEISLNKSFVAAFLQTYFNCYKSKPKQHILNYHYKVPDIIVDIQVLDQVFLI